MNSITGDEMSVEWMENAVLQKNEREKRKWHKQEHWIWESEIGEIKWKIKGNEWLWDTFLAWKRQMEI